MEKRPEVTSAQIENSVLKFGPEDIADHGKIRAAEPTFKEQMDAFGPEAYTPLGKDAAGREKYRFDIKGKRAMRRYFEMMEKSMRLKSERGMKVQSGIGRVTLKNKETGQLMEVADFHAAQVGRAKGFVERAYWGRPSFRKTEKQYREEMAK